MASTAPKYYRPFYLSDSEESDASADDSDAESQLSEEVENLPDYVSFAQGLFRAAGPPFQTEETEISYAVNSLDRHTVYGPMVEGQAGYDLVTTNQQVDNVIVLQSLDRDKRIYPQPINCQLMLPRTYVNVTRFEIADISFVASFFYFRADKYNTSLLFKESDRVTFAPVLVNPTVSSPELKLSITIREGTYSIDTILGEISTQFNTPPLFYDFINGYSDFYKQFNNAGDYSLIFNYPGDYYYDAVSRIYIANPTIDQIVSYYFQQRFALPTTANSTYTDLQTKVVYYYPVVKELILDTTYKAAHNPQITYAGSPLTAALQTQLLYSFTGLDDIIMSDIVASQENITTLEAYRLAHTFRYYPVNKYVCTYSTQTNYVCIQSTSLNTSLSSLLNSTYNNFLAIQIQRAGISLATFNTSANQITAYKSILFDMNTVLQSNFAYIFGVNYGQYADTYFLSFSNSILLKNGLYASNVVYDYNQRVSPSITTNIQRQFVQSNITYWQNMYNLTSSNLLYSNTYIDSNSGVNVYNIKTLSSDFRNVFEDANGNIYVNPVEHSSDVVVTINPGAYTILPLKSSFRQTAQIEVLPRPSRYLYPEWIASNADVIGNNQYVFTGPSYTFGFPTGTDSNGIGSNISYTLGSSLSNLGTIVTLSNSILALNTLTIQATPNGAFFTFLTPPHDPTSTTVYKYLTALSIFPGTPQVSGDVPPIDSSDNLFADSVSVFVYHDQAAFYADIGPAGRSNGENPFFYKYMTVIPAGSPAHTITFTAYEDQQYYVICRPTNILSFSPIPYTIVPFISSNSPTPLYADVNFDPRLPTFDPYVVMQSNFYVAKVHDPDYIRLPIIDSNGYYYKTNIPSCNIGFLPSSSTLSNASNAYSGPSPSNAALNTLLLKPIIPLGYFSTPLSDGTYVSVSDDLTDYIPIINTFPPRAYDLMNNYFFRYTPDVSSYNTATQTYGIGNSTNAILNPDGTTFYGSNTNPRREKRIVQYTGTHYIFTASNEFTAKTPLQPLNSTTIPGLNTPFILLSNLQGVRQVGPCGFLFMPEEGTWQIKSITILLQTSNTRADFLAIYPASYINGISTKNASLSEAICICVQRSSVTYYNTAAPTGVPYGTYYTYSNVFTIQPNYIISGKTQNTTEFITDTNCYYSAIAYCFNDPNTLYTEIYTMDNFTSATTTLQTLDNLSGTCIPYPDLGLYVSSTFYDGTPSPDNYSLILSSNAPFGRIGNDRYMNPTTNPNFMYSNYYTSQYAQSSPIVNSHLHFLQTEYSASDFQNYTNFFLPWYNVPGVPTNVTATVEGYLMFQTSVFPIVSYPLTSESTNFTLTSTISLDSVFNLLTTFPLAQSGNSTSYIFLGATNDNLVFSEYVVSSGTLHTYSPIPINFDTRKFSVQSLFIQGTQWWLAFTDTTGLYLAYGTNFTDGYTQMSIPFPGLFTSAEMSVDSTNGSNVYFAFSTNSTKTYSNIYSYPMSYGLPITNELLDLQIFDVDPSTTHFTIQSTNNREYIYQIRSASPYVYRTDTVTRALVKSQQNLGNQPVKCVAGANNSIWILFTSQPYIQAFVFTVESIHIAWQQFFPVLKVELVAQVEKRLSIPDLYNLATPEWGHTLAFGYSNLANLNKDLYFIRPSTLQSGVGQWGKESYYQVSDTSFQGYYFNAYLGDMPLQASNTSYVALRGFSPTESFQTEVRVSLPNVYDLGYVSINDMIPEIANLSVNPSQYSAVYSRQLSAFDKSFVRSNVDALYGISSLSVPTVGFSNFIVQYSTLYGEYAILKSTTDVINSNLRTSMQNFIQNDMKYILPSNVLARTRFTDALTFSFLWKTGLQQTPPNYANLVDGWGLGWNLGYPKEDDSQPSTVHFAPSMYKIIDDFLYLRLNPEFNLNRMSAGTKENYNDSREPSGLTSYYYCKLLLNGYGQTATTFVHSPIVLSPPIPKISKIAFQWLDARGNLLNIPSATDSDWQMTVNIQENVQTTNFIQTSNVKATDFLRPRSDRGASSNSSPSSSPSASSSPGSV